MARELRKEEWLGIGGTHFSFWWWAYPFLVWSFQRDYVNNCERGRHDMESKVIYGYGYERKK